MKRNIILSKLLTLFSKFKDFFNSRNLAVDNRQQYCRQLSAILSTAISSIVDSYRQSDCRSLTIEFSV
ncbi:hypothetical protein M2137_000285 [Parabacteroides sp. PFB2-10]|nr:hypothetical protein [Parabacteroides sp. PFB2-10]